MPEATGRPARPITHPADSGLVLRPLTAGESALFTSLPDAGLVGRPLLGQPFATLDEGGEYRPEWSWVALRDGRVVARAAWWGKPGDAEPIALDWFDFADGEAAAAAELLRVAPLDAEYDLMLPPGWREQPAVREQAEARMAAAEAAGLRKLVERYRYTWTAGADPLPDRTGRLVYAPEPDDGAFRALMTRIMAGTLDAHDRRLIDARDVDAAVDDALGFLDWLPSPSGWRRIARTPDGEVVGLHVPAENPSGPCVGFVAVVPEQRGHGYAYDLLVECTNDLVDRGATRIAAATDQANSPMAAHFARAGYPITQERVNFIRDLGMDRAG